MTTSAEAGSAAAAEPGFTGRTAWVRHLQTPVRMARIGKKLLELVEQVREQLARGLSGQPLPPR